MTVAVTSTYQESASISLPCPSHEKKSQKFQVLPGWYSCPRGMPQWQLRSGSSGWLITLQGGIVSGATVRKVDALPSSAALYVGASSASTSSDWSPCPSSIQRTSPISLLALGRPVSQHTLETIQSHQAREVSHPQGGGHHKVLLRDGELVFRTRLLVGVNSSGAPPCQSVRHLVPSDPTLAWDPEADHPP